MTDPAPTTEVRVLCRACGNPLSTHFECSIDLHRLLAAAEARAVSAEGERDEAVSALRIHSEELFSAQVALARVTEAARVVLDEFVPEGDGHDGSMGEIPTMYIESLRAAVANEPDAPAIPTALEAAADFTLDALRRATAGVGYESYQGLIEAEERLAKARGSR